MLFMLAAGLTLVFSLMGVLNFAHAAFHMLGAYVAYQLAVWVGFWPALLLAPLLVGLLGAAVEAFGLSRVRRDGHAAELLFTFGLSWVLVELVQLAWGRAAVPFELPASLQGPLFTIGATHFPKHRAFTMAVALLVLAVLGLALERTKLGRVIRASLTHPRMVEALGHDLPRIRVQAFAAGTALGALAGVLGGAVHGTEPAMAAQVGPIVFVVAVVGGLGSLGGAFVASLLIGLLQTVAVDIELSALDLLRPLGVSVRADSPLQPLLGLTVSRTAPLLPYLLLVAVLAWRPSGLMGRRSG